LLRQVTLAQKKEKTQEIREKDGKGSRSRVGPPMRSGEEVVEGIIDMEKEINTSLLDDGYDVRQPSV